MNRITLLFLLLSPLFLDVFFDLFCFSFSSFSFFLLFHCSRCGRQNCSFFFTSFDFESTSFYEQSEHYFSYSSFLEHYVSTTKFIHLTRISSLIYWSSTMFTIWIMIVVEHKRISSHWILMFEQQRKWINSGLKPRLLRSLWLHFNRPAAYFFPEHALQTYYKAMC